MDPNTNNNQNQEPTVATAGTDIQPTIDTASALADISNDLFGQGGDFEKGPTGAVEGTEADAPGKPSPVDAQPQSQPNPEDNSQAVQELGAPKTWTKEAIAEWAAVPPRVQQEILKREEDALKGITQYKSAAEGFQRYDSVVEPYRAALTEANIDPVQLFQSFAANHYLLSRGTEDQKLELASNLISGYGIDLNKLISFIGDRMVNPPDPRLSSLEQENARLRQESEARKAEETKATAERLNSEIEAFANDPANPYFNELVDDIAKLFETGQATNLKEAYEKAVYLNPVTRQKELDRLAGEKAKSLTAEEQQRRDRHGRFTAADVTLDPKSRNGTVPVGSIDDTLAETLAAIKARG